MSCTTLPTPAHRVRRGHVGALIAACLILSGRAAAQTMSIVQGTVTLPDGAAAPGASVAIAEIPGSAVTADATGHFVLTDVVSGHFTLVATLEGHNAGRALVTTRGGDTVAVRIRLGAPLQLAQVAVVATRPTRATYVADTASSATKTAAPLMQVPVSIQVVPRAVLQDQQALRIDDVLVNVAGVLPIAYGQLTYDEYTVRGFDLAGVSYDDGLRQDEAELGGLARDMANVERIEVVKGPASVLYGQAQPGGLVNVVTKQPLTTPQYTIDQQVGSFATYRTTLDATAPLNDTKTILYRLNLDYESSGSFRDFIYTRRFAAFPTLEIKPSDRVRITLETSYATGKSVGDDGLPFVTSTLAPARVPFDRNYSDANSNFGKSTQYWFKLTGTQALTGNLSVHAAARSEYVSDPVPLSEYYAGDVDATGYLPRFLSTGTSS